MVPTFCASTELMDELESERQTPAPRLVRPPPSKNHKIKISLVDKPKLIDGTSEALRAPAHHNAARLQTRFQWRSRDRKQDPPQSFRGSHFEAEHSAAGDFAVLEPTSVEQFVIKPDFPH